MVAKALPFVNCDCVASCICISVWGWEDHVFLFSVVLLPSKALCATHFYEKCHINKLLI